MCVCLFGVFRPTREFFTHFETSPLQWSATNFDLYLALRATEQWRCFNVLHILWHGPTPLTLKTFPSECILDRASIYICLQGNKYVHWVKIQYLSWMLNTNFCVPDEKYSRKHVYIVSFSYVLVLERRGKYENSANAALKCYPSMNLITGFYEWNRIAWLSTI